MAPSVLNSTASYFRQSSQNREALNFSASASFAPIVIEPIAEMRSALPWKSGSGVYMVSPGLTRSASNMMARGAMS